MIAEAVRAPVIRQATDEDSAALFRVLVDLATTSRYTGGAVLNAAHLRAMLARMLANLDAGFLVATVDDDIVGLLVMLLYDDLISGQRKAAEVCWYVQPAQRNGLGVRLLAAAEQWAEAHEATTIQMISPDQRFGSLYFRRGYVPVHRVFERGVLPCRG